MSVLTGYPRRVLTRALGFKSASPLTRTKYDDALLIVLQERARCVRRKRAEEARARHLSREDV